MRSILRSVPGWLMLALLPFAVHAVPVLDSAFGTQGIVRIGTASGFEDQASASAMLADGRIIVAGTSTGRQNYGFVTRFTTGGATDMSFGNAGATLLMPPAAHFWIAPVAVDVLPDGRFLVTSAIHDGFVLTRLTAQGVVDGTFGTGGSVVVIDTDAAGGSQDVPVRVAVQSDGRLLVVSNASANRAFVLRFRRFLPDGAPDNMFGVRNLTNLPRDFAFTSARLAVVEPGGGFTLAALPTTPGGTFLIVPVTSQGTLDTTLGMVGYASGIDLSAADFLPSTLTRLSDGGYALFGAPRITAEPDAILKITPTGARSTTFGDAGRVFVGTGLSSHRAITPLPDGGVAIAQGMSDARIRISAFNATGAPLPSFGSGGSVVVPVAGYISAYPVGIHADTAGRITAAGWANARFVLSGPIPLPRGSDVILASVSASGVPRSDFGRGDGTAIWNNPAFSNDRIDSLIVDPAGRINIVGFSDSSGTFDYLLSRLNPNGTLDPAFGANGRLTPGVFARFVGNARAVRQPDGALVVASGEAAGSVGSFRTATMFRATPNGSLDASFRPTILAAGPNGTPGLGVRADGRIVYLTNEFAATAPGTASYVLQQFLPDGTSDPSFGVNGRAMLPASDYQNTFSGDLVVLGDGSIVFAVFPDVIGSDSTLRLYKVDAAGSLVTSFGVSGIQSVADQDIAYGRFGFRLLALADGTLMTIAPASVRAPTPSGPAQRLAQVVRFSAGGTVISKKRLAMDESGGATAAVALSDSSVVIARVVAPGVPTLVRLLPDDQFDQAFDGEIGTPVTFTSVSALALDAAGGLIVGGQDASGALVARYRIDGPATTVVAVEYFNVNLRHYFVTANAAEQRSIETGGAGPGWQRTGNDFRLWVPESGVPVGAVPVCRFYGTPGRGPNSHFYTANPAECAAVKRDPGWTYEGIAFYAIPPVNDQCVLSAPVHRAYNNGFVRNDSNHRYSTQPTLLQAMVSQGWVVEGVAFCGAWL